MAKELNKEKLDKAVDILLSYKGTPRDRLFEYPYRADDSRKMIENAEYVVRRISATLNQE
jgi:hypothetical protein